MFVKLVRNRNNTHYVQIVESYRSHDGVVKHRLIKSLGLLEELEKDNPTFLQDLRLQVSTEKEELKVTIDFMDNSQIYALNYGYFILKKVLQDLEVTKNEKDSGLFESLLFLLVEEFFGGHLDLNTFYEWKKSAYFQLSFPPLSKVKQQLKNVTLRAKYVMNTLNNKLNRERNFSLMYRVNYTVNNHANSQLDRNFNHDIDLFIYKNEQFQTLGYQISLTRYHSYAAIRPLITTFMRENNLLQTLLIGEKNDWDALMDEYLITGDLNYLYCQNVDSNDPENYLYDQIHHQNGYFAGQDGVYWYKPINLHRTVRVTTSNKQNLYREIHEHGLIFRLDAQYSHNSVFEVGNQWLKEKHEVEFDNTINLSSSDHELGDKWDEGGQYFYLYTNSLRLTAQEMVSYYNKLQEVHQEYSLSQLDPFYEGNISPKIFISYLANIVKEQLALKLTGGLSVGQILDALNESLVLPIEQGVVKITKSQAILDIFFLYGVDITSSYFREEELVKLLKFT
jgi:hypothetical protein